MQGGRTLPPPKLELTILYYTTRFFDSEKLKILFKANSHKFLELFQWSLQTIIWGLNSHPMIFIRSKNMIAKMELIESLSLCVSLSINKRHYRCQYMMIPGSTTSCFTLPTCEASIRESPSNLIRLPRQCRPNTDLTIANAIVNTSAIGSMTTN